MDKEKKDYKNKDTKKNFIKNMLLAVWKIFWFKHISKTIKWKHVYAGFEYYSASQ